MVSVIQDGGNGKVAAASVIQQSKHDVAPKSLCATIVVDGVPYISIVGVPLHRNAPYVCELTITGSDRVRDCSPPLVCDLS